MWQIGLRTLFIMAADLAAVTKSLAFDMSDKGVDEIKINPID